MKKQSPWLWRFGWFGCAILCARFNAFCDGTNWTATESIPIGSMLVRILADGARSQLYAVDRANSDILIVKLATHTVRRIYVGHDPTDLDLDATGRFLYVANKGPGTGAPGSDRIGVIDLDSETVAASWVSPVTVNYVTAGRSGRVYSNSGIENWNFGDARSFDTITGVDLGSFSAVKTRMVISSDKTFLYGQYVYTGNLGEMGVFDVSGDTIKLVDRLRYPPYTFNYGWGLDNYCLSSDDKVLGYGPVLFNARNLIEQLGILPENVWALNADGSVAFGESGIWDTTTFVIHGGPTKIGALPGSTTVMNYNRIMDALVMFMPTDRTIRLIEKTTLSGTPLRWLAKYGIPNTIGVDRADLDGDGIDNKTEWTLDTDPTKVSEALRIELDSIGALSVNLTSPLRRYSLQRNSMDPMEATSSPWQEVSTQQGTGGRLDFTLGAGTTNGLGAMFRLQVIQ